MQVLLPHVVEVLTRGNADIKMKALMVLGNAMGHLKGKEAIPFTAQLAEELLLLFDDVRLMGEPEPRRGAPCNGSCPSAQPCGQPSEQALLPWALVGWLLSFAAQHGFPLLQNLTPEHLPSHQPR